MVKPADLEKRLLELEGRLNKHKYFITLLPGALLKRDISTNEIEYIDSNNDEYEGLELSIDQFILVDMFALESWEAIPDSQDMDDRQGIKNNPEKCWILEHMHPGKTARQAWRREVKQYEEYMANHHTTSPQVNSSPVMPSIPKSPKDAIIQEVIEPSTRPKSKIDEEIYAHDFKPNW